MGLDVYIARLTGKDAKKAELSELRYSGQELYSRVKGRIRKRRTL